MATTASITLAALALLLSGGCDSSFVIDSDGSIEVAISTRGLDLDSDGYSLTVDGAQAYILPPAGSLVLQLAQGSHTVQVGGLAANCAVEGANPRSVVVGPSGAVDVSFTVTCERATTGGFKVIVTTAGTGSDPNGYELSVAGSSSRQIDPEATEVFEGLTAGMHLITLKDSRRWLPAAGRQPPTVHRRPRQDRHRAPHGAVRALAELTRRPRRRLARLRRAPPLVHIHEEEQHAAHHEEGDHRQDGVPARAGQRDGDREEERPEDAGELLEHAEEAEELRRLVRRGHAREERAAQRLGAALHHADQRGQHEEVPRRAA